MTIKDLAERLGIGYSLARDLMRSFRPPTNFPSICIGRTWVVDEVAYEHWYAQHHGATVYARPHANTVEPKRCKRNIHYESKPDFSNLNYYPEIKSKQ